MFKFLKEKLRSVVDSMKKSVEEEVEVETKVVEKLKPKKAEKNELLKKKSKSSEKKTKKTVEKKGEPESDKKIEREVEKRKEEGEESKKEESPKKEKILDEELIEEIEDVDKIKDAEEVEEKEEKKGFLGRLFSKKKDVEEEQKSEAEKTKEEIQEELEELKESDEEVGKEIVEEETEDLEEKKGFFGRVTERFTKFNLSHEKFEELFWDLEMALLENNVAVEVIERIKVDLKEELCTGKISKKGIGDVIKDSLKKSIEEVLDVQEVDIFKEANKKKPYIIAFIGVNGSGKTTNMAKLAKKFLDKGKTVVFAASDTFRAAAIQQLEEHANNLGIKMIKHDYNADPAAVAFDAIEHAKARGIDIVMIDTAGRLHSNTNLMQELKKLIKVNNPDFKIFVGESITGNDCIEQATVYNNEVGIDGIILSKADVDEKGGAAISVSYVTKKPILFIGTGQTYDDLKEFDKNLILKSLDLE